MSRYPTRQVRIDAVLERVVDLLRRGRVAMVDVVQNVLASGLEALGHECCGALDAVAIVPSAVSTSVVVDATEPRGTRVVLHEIEPPVSKSSSIDRLVEQGSHVATASTVAYPCIDAYF